LLLFGKVEPQSIWRSKTSFGIGAGIILVICMLFPITESEGHIFYLHQLPLIVGFLYLGVAAGALLYFTLLVTLHFTAPVGWLEALVVDTSLLIALLLLQRKFGNLSVRDKSFAGTALALLSCLSIGAYRIGTGAQGPDELSFLAPLYVALSIGVILIISSIEKAKWDFARDKRIQKADKERIVSEMAAAVSHEIRNPLTVTKGFLQLVISQQTQETSKKHLELALEELTRAENVITNYLSFAKPAREHPVLFNVNEQLAKVVGIVTPYANMQNVQIHFRAYAELQACGEPQKFHQCISNLLKNAVEAMPSGGHIIIDLYQHREKVVLKLTDTGVGMTREQLRLLGEPYFSTKENGTGLGMMVVYDIVRSMRGEITVMSEKGVGTQFTLEFPSGQPAAGEWAGAEQHLLNM